MAESIQKEMDNLSEIISYLEKSLPFILSKEDNKQAVELIVYAADRIGQLTFDPSFPKLGTIIKVLAGGGSSLLTTVTYQAFILDIIELFQKIKEDFQTSGPPKSTEADNLVGAGEFLIRLAGRLTHRFKIKVIFEQDYEAKGIRAFMVLNELKKVVRFLGVAPDIAENPNPNLDNGMEIDALSQEDPNELHRIAGSILEVASVQVFVESKNQPVFLLDPPSRERNYDRKINDYLNR